MNNNLTSIFYELLSYDHSQDDILEQKIKLRLNKNFDVYEKELDNVLSTLSDKMKIRMLTRNEKL